jgi:hypothetical protein
MIQPLEQIYERALVDTSIVSYWQIPKYQPTLDQIIEVHFEKFNTQYIFGRDDNFMLKTANGKSVLNIYNFFGWTEMTQIDRLLCSIHHGSLGAFNTCMDIFGHNEKHKVEDNSHFRDRFSSIEAEYFYFESKDEAYENYAQTKANDNKTAQVPINVEEEILDTYPELFV